MQTIYLDISNKGVIPTIHAKQADVGRKFRAVLIDGGMPYNTAEDSAFSVWYKGASGEGNYTHIGSDSAFSVIGNIVEVELIEQMISVAGNTTACLVLSTSDGHQIATWNIEISVEAVPGFGSGVAEEYYTAFSQTAAQVKLDADRAAAAASKFVIDSTLTVRGASAEASAVGDALNDIRGDLGEKQPIGNYLEGTDSSLSESGYAADAYAVGQRFDNLPRLVYSNTDEPPAGLRNGDFWARPKQR